MQRNYEQHSNKVEEIYTSNNNYQYNQYMNMNFNYVNELRDDVRYRNTILFAVFLGLFGVHRFFNGRIKTGGTLLLLSVFSIGVIGSIWCAIDLIFILSGKFKNSEGYYISTNKPKSQFVSTYLAFYGIFSSFSYALTVIGGFLVYLIMNLIMAGIHRLLYG